MLITDCVAYTKEAARDPRGKPGLMLVLILVLLWGTGLATDDFVHLANSLHRKLTDNLLPKEYISVPLLHYTHGLLYYLIGDNLWGYDLLKGIYAGVSVYFSARFFKLFLPMQRAWLFGFLFVFFPFHEAATFWLTGQYLILSFSFYLFAYAQGAVGRYTSAALWATIASFSSYGSPPIAVGLSLLAVFKRRWRHAVYLLFPNLLYVTYYLCTVTIFKSGTQRMTGEFSIQDLTKHFALQIATFVDSAFGLSAWAKIVYSLAALQGVALLAALALVLVFVSWL